MCCCCRCEARVTYDPCRLNLKGDPEWMKNANKEKVEFVMLTEMVDARGNVVKLKGKKKSEMTRKERMA